MDDGDTLGLRFARALAAKDQDELTGVLHPEIDFRGMTPRRVWEAGSPHEVIEIALGSWFEDSDEILGIERLESDAFADRERVGYRFGVRNPDGEFLVEQQAYVEERDGRIGWMRLVCSGFRPVG